MDHTQAVVDEVCSFLGLETAVDVAGVDAHQNRSPVSRWPGLQLLFNYCTTGVETRSEGQLPYPAKPQSSYALQGLVHHLRQLNLTPRRPPQFRSSSKAGMLTSPHNKRDLPGKIRRSEDARTEPNESVEGASRSEIMPLMSYRASAGPVLRWERSVQVVPGLHEIREVAALGAERPSTHRGGHRQSARQMLR
ncbi:hypothetical protein GGP93_001814 [Salinibacter ruber]|nr:hypothetical protein [Salinibacter ruber]